MSNVAADCAIMKSGSWPLMSSTGPCNLGRSSEVGNDDGGAPGVAFCTPELNTPIALTRGSAPSAIERNPPHDWPMTATLSRAILPLSGEPVGAFSFPAHSIAARRSSAVACRCGAPFWRTVPITRKPSEAIVVRKPEYRVLSIPQPPWPHTITGNASFFGNASSISGRKTRWPGELKAFSDVTLYGPGAASGAPSRGNARSIISRVMPGGCARHTPALVRTAATMVLRIVLFLRTGIIPNRDQQRTSQHPSHVCLIKLSFVKYDTNPEQYSGGIAPRSRRHAGRVRGT